jgi:hypothetical protein
MVFEESPETLLQNINTGFSSPGISKITANRGIQSIVGGAHYALAGGLE